MESTELTIEPASSESPEARALIQQMWNEMKSLYKERQPLFQPLGCPREGAVFLLARIDGLAVACGAVVPMSEGVGEVKRMYVEPAHRGRGLSRAVLRELERRAPVLGYSVVRLDTGIHQPAAIRLYETSGYLRIPNYASPVGEDMSLCFEKRL